MADYAQMSDREIDAQIQERLMPWDESRCRVCGWALRDAPSGCRPDHCAMRPEPNPRADAPAHYSTDHNAAFAAVAKMKAKGFDFTLPSHPKNQCVAMFCRDGERGGRAEAATAPRAICEAILLALDADAAKEGR